jgi:hypothetical protein
MYVYFRIICPRVEPQHFTSKSEGFEGENEYDDAAKNEEDELVSDGAEE